MHGFSKDGAHLFVHDGFGLTKISFPKSVKTDVDLAGDWLSIGGNRLVVSVTKTNRKVHRTADELRNLRWKAGDYGRAALVHDDERAISFDAASLSVNGTEKDSTNILEWPDEMPKLGAVVLGDAPVGEGRAKYAFAIGESGLLAHYISEQKKVFIAKLRGAKTLVPHGALSVGALRAPPTLVVHGETVFVCAFDRSKSEAKLCAVTERKVSAVETVKSISAPTFSGTRWCWQPDEGTVLCAEWEKLAAPERFEIPEATRGSGAVMGYGDARLLFALPNAERVYDLRSKAVFDRKLPATERAMRDLARSKHARTDRWLAEEGGALTVANLAVDRRKKKSATWSPEFDMGRGTVSTFFAFGDLVHARFAAPDAPDALTINSYTSPGPPSPCSLDDVRRAFAAVDRYGANVRLGMMALESAMGEFFEQSKKKKGQWPRLFDDAAAKALLVAFFEADKSAERLAVRAEDADRWAKREVSVEWMKKQRFAEGERALGDLPKAAAWLALDLLGEEALSVLTWWFVEAPSPEIKESSFTAVDVLSRLIERYPSTKKAVWAACKAAGEYGEEVKSEVESAL